MGSRPTPVCDNHSVGGVHSWFLRLSTIGEFTAVPGVNQVLLTPADVQVDSRTDPTFMIATLCGSKTGLYGGGHTLYT